MLHEITPHKLDISYRPEQPKQDDYVVCVSQGMVLVNDGECVSLPTVGEFGFMEEELQFLFHIDAVSFFMARRQRPIEADERYHYLSLRDIRCLKPMWQAYAAILGCRLCIFYDTNRYCGKCGSAMEHSKIERAMVCPRCAHTIYPQIAPSVIVLIRNGEKVVLTKYQASHSAFRNYALVAGYVETGESAEETVRREVMEEVGLKVKNIRFYKSSPWPLSGALLLGFVCDLDGDDTINREEDELAVAEWIRREDVPAKYNDISLSGEMMEMFRIGKL